MLSISLQSTLGQDDAAAEVAATLPTVWEYPAGQTKLRPQILAPAIPDGVPMRCSYDASVAAWRCSYGTFWERPSTYLIGGSIVGTFIIGLVLGSSGAFRKALGLVKKTVA